jgi:hypothetical protein
MPDLVYRFALSSLASYVLLSIALLPWSSSVSGLWNYSNEVVVWNRLPAQRSHVMVGAVVPSVVPTAVLSREARHDLRWNGVLPLRPLLRPEV